MLKGLERLYLTHVFRVHWQWGDANLTKGSYKTSFNVMSGQEFNIFHTFIFIVTERVFGRLFT
jgi:hypothetical protein